MIRQNKIERVRASIKAGFYQNLQMFMNSQNTKNQAMGQQAINQMLSAIQSSNGLGHSDLTAIFANEIAKVLSPAQNKDAPHFIEMAIENSNKTSDKKLKRDILYKAAGHYSSLRKFDKAVKLYLKSRKYSDVKVDPAEDMRELRETGDSTTFGLSGDQFYAMATLQAANHMDPENKDTIKT
ncbi:MAG: hypothetical protein ACTSQF_04945, partial [Candidatus Heimdallarchaeaceae archaeon]